MACPAPTQAAAAAGVAAPLKTARQQLQRLEALAQSELAQLEQIAARQAAARHSHEQASVGWDLGLDARELAPAGAGQAMGLTRR